MSSRRYDIDWVRVIAIGLLLVYHTAIGFQAWGIMIGFIATERPWPTLWIPMTIINIWRIPLLFFVSGMGVYYALQNRNWKHLILERAQRILIPFLFGIFVIVPLGTFLWQYHYGWELAYSYSPGHLWFLGNIFAYVIILSPVFYYLNKNKAGKVVRSIKAILSTPLGLLPVIIAFVAEAMVMNPRPFELYAMTWHGFIIGILAFFFGFCFVISGDTFWKMITKWRWLFLLIAAVLCVIRLTQFQPFAPNYLIAIESSSWIISVFAFSFRHLNRPSRVLSYLSEAAYPVYILHMLFLYVGSMIIFPLDIPSYVQFALLLLFTIVGCFMMFEFVVSRINFLRPLFGLKVKRQIQTNVALS
jgi:peptidoglycan/LPS O-acetylase OafA/YrhL